MTCLDRFFTDQGDNFELDRHNCMEAKRLHNEKTAECDAKQTRYEVDYCSRETKVQGACKDYDQCRVDNERSLINVKAETEDIEDIFQAQFVALYHLLCYGQKILAN